MIRENNRVRFIDKEKDKIYGILSVFSINGEFVTIGKGDYTSLGKDLMSVNITDLKLAE